MKAGTLSVRLVYEQSRSENLLVVIIQLTIMNLTNHSPSLSPFVDHEVTIVYCFPSSMSAKYDGLGELCRDETIAMPGRHHPTIEWLQFSTMFNVSLIFCRIRLITQMITLDRTR